MKDVLDLNFEHLGYVLIFFVQMEAFEEREAFQFEYKKKKVASCRALYWPDTN
jgi:hypothetical protein